MSSSESESDSEVVQNTTEDVADAEEEQQRLGTNSGLHIIIFDELDAICKQRGSSGGSTGVHDTVNIYKILLEKIMRFDSLVLNLKKTKFS